MIIGSQARRCGVAGSSGAAAAEPLWVPSEERRRAAVISRYLDWLERDRGLAFPSYDELWAWSVRDIEAFWQSVWDFFGVVAHQPPPPCSPSTGCPGRGGSRGRPSTTPSTRCAAATTIPRWLRTWRDGRRAPSATASWPARWGRSQPGCAGWVSAPATGWPPTCRTSR